MFENELFQDHYATEYIAAWSGAGGTFVGTGVDDFNKWLESRGLNDDERFHIVTMALASEPPLKINAATFIRNNTK